MRLVSAVVIALLLILPTHVLAQADSAPRDSTRPDSARRDSARRDSARGDSARPDSARRDSTPPDSTRPDSQRKPAARPPAAVEPPVHTLAAGECPSAVERSVGDALRRFAAPQARRPVALAKPVLRDPSLRGRTTIALEVDTLGRADSSTVRIVEGDSYLLPTARSSVARWRFRPAELHPGCRVRARTIETVTF